MDASSTPIGDDAAATASDDSSSSSPNASFLPSSIPPTWQTAYVSVLLALMILVLASDRLGSDAVTMTVLTALLVAPGIISINEALQGFANSGLWTVMVLAVVTEAIHKTSAFGWYMRRFVLGMPKTHGEAQLRLMVPVTLVSAFLSNTPLVVAMVPIVQQWADNARLDVQQLLIPLSWATILGGTITVIGTSANLVVMGALDSATFSSTDGGGATTTPAPAVNMFELALYGIPNALVGLAYMLLVSPFLLGRGRHFDPQQQQGGIDPNGLTVIGGNGNGMGGGGGGGNADDPILLGARLTPWSPAAGRSVERSGLRDTGGIYLVSVVRAQTGHVHRAVSRDFILNVGDVLYFTGLVESFADFCGEHGLELLTNETEDLNHDQDSASYGYHEEDEEEEEEKRPEDEDEKNEIGDGDVVPALNGGNRSSGNLNGSRDVLDDGMQMSVDHVPVGVTKDSLLRANRSDRLRCLAYMTDLIRGYQPPTAEELLPLTTSSVVVRAIDPRPQIVVAADDDNSHNDYEALVCVGINCFDRPGLILDISKTLQRLSLQFKNTEACVTDHRSVSIWRCRHVLSQRGLQNNNNNNRGDTLDGEIWTALHSLLCPNTGVHVIKQRGLRVVRAQVTKNSRLIDKTASEVEFRAWYGAAIVAVQSAAAAPSHPSGSQVSSPISATSPDLSSLRFREDDVLILQADDDSPLLQPPPDNFPATVDNNNHLSNLPPTSLPSSLVTSLFGRNGSHHHNAASQREFDEAALSTPIPPESEHGSIVIETVHVDVETGNDLYEAPSDTVRDEVRAAWNDLKVLSHHVTDGDTDAYEQRAAPEFLTAMRVSKKAGWIGKTARDVGLHNLQNLVLVSIERQTLGSAFGSDAVESVRNEAMTLQSLHQDMPLDEGDILWFSGPAFAIASLRRIPGLESYEHDEVKKMHEKVHERRLVQAVVSRHGPLVGKTVKEVQFRTRYGAAVIAVQREGKRVHQLPGVIKLQAGDVLLLEAGPAFLGKNPQNDTSFSLLVEVKDSSPPRLRFLIPTLVIFVAAVAVYAAQVTSLFTSMLVAAIVLVFIGVISVQEARNSLNWDMYITVAAAFGISNGLVNSGVAGGYADFLVMIGNGVGLGDAGVIAGVYLTTVLVSNVLTNAAAAALLFPMALNAASQAGTSPSIMAFTVMLGASASFIYPYGYSTNLLIFGPGKYKFTDFLLFGAPLQLILWISATAILSVDSWRVPWIVAWSIFLSAVAVRVAFSFLRFPT